MDKFKRYIVLWLSQGISQLGSSMTGIALELWNFQESQSAMSISLMTFCQYVPYILASIVAGDFVDRHRKKTIMLASDSIAACGSLVVLGLIMGGKLEVWNIYVINAVIGLTTAFQQPASSVAIGKIVPKEKLSKVSGMNSFSSNMIMLLSPTLAGALFAVGGVYIILFIDLLSFLFAFLVLLFLIPIPEVLERESNAFLFAGIAEGIRFLKKERGLLYIMLTLAFINFFSRLTYENILLPMILLRSGGNSVAYGIVFTCMGIGGSIGGLIVSVKKGFKKNASIIYRSAALSFLFGDLLMGMGRNPFWWSLAGIMASLPIPFIMAGQNVILYQRIPEKMQGRVFAVRNAIQFSTIPLGILMGGFLAQYVFEPFMKSKSNLVSMLEMLVGSGEGSGMAVMFLCTGICGSLICIITYFNKEIKKLN